MRRYHPSIAGALALLLILTVMGTALGQDYLDTPETDPITAPAGREHESVKGQGELWKEDPGRVEAGRETLTPSDRYMDVLKQTGLLDHLRDRPNRTEDKAFDTWRRLGPVGAFGSPSRNGRISGIQVIQSGSYYRVYAGACQGGLWRMWSGQFANWTDIGRNLPNPSVRAFMVDPANFNHIIVGTGDHRRYDGGGMFETFDEGYTWNQVALPIGTPDWFYRVLHLGTDPGSGQVRLAAASSSGPLYSDDGGATWQRGQDMSGVNLGARWTDMVQHPTNPSWVYAVCCEEYVAGGRSGVYISTNYGENWARFTSSVLPSPENWSRASLAMCRNTPGTLAVLVTYENSLIGVYRSTNIGYDWTNITGALIDTGSGYLFGGDQSWHAQAIAIKPDDPNFIIVACVGLATSDDGGATWAIGETESGIDVGHVDFTQLYFNDVNGPDTMWMGNDGGIYYHKFSTGTTYQALGNATSGLACSEIDYLDAERLVRGIGLQDNGTVLSFDGAATWQFVEGGDGADVEIFDAEDGDVFFDNGVYGPPAWRTWRLYRGGAKEDTNNPEVYMPRLHYSPYTGMFYTHDQTGLYSMNATGTLSWTLRHSNWQTLPYRIRNIYAAYGRDDAAWVVYWRDSSSTWEGDEDLTYVYKNGTIWDENHMENFNGSGNPVMCVTPSNEWPDEAWVGIRTSPGSAKIYHLQDKGATKTNITSGPLTAVSNVLCIAVMPFNPDVIWAGTEVGVFRTTDGGATWTPFMDGGLPIGRCSELLWVDDHTHSGTHKLVLAMDGRGVWECDIDYPPIIYVDGRVLTSGDGSRWGGAYKTVAEALAVAPAGSIIAIHSDSYSEPQTAGKNVKLVTWQGNTRIH